MYARVWSADQRVDLDRQVARVTAWAASEGLPVARVVTEVGSALNGKRRKFVALLRDEDVATIVVEHRDASPGPALNTWRRHCRHKGADCWSWTLPRWTTILSGT